MKSKKIREKFDKFFEEKGHKVVPSSSLIPDDKTVLLTSAGMQQFIPYFSGDKDVMEDFGNKHLASIQKCFRTPDIEEVGDDTHHTFFEMLGNWSIGGDYFKEGAIDLALEFFVKEMKLDKDKLWVTIFEGTDDIPKDNEAFQIWKDKGIPEERIEEFGMEDNFWGPVAQTGPCGPCSEIHYDRGEKYGCGKDCGPNCEECNRFVELWNLVFMEYMKTEDGSFKKLDQKNIDTGIGFERLVAIKQEESSAYETDLFLPIIRELENISGKKYSENKKYFRIITDHIKGASFLIVDGIRPSNEGRGYILRRVLRRAIRYGKLLDLRDDFLSDLIYKVIEVYGKDYPALKDKKEEIQKVIKKEREKFERTLEEGLKELEKIIDKKEEVIDGEEAFYLYQSFGFPIELTEEIVEEKDLKIDKEGFYKAKEEHKKVSRAGAEKKFGGLSDKDDYQEVKLHTATHILQRCLRKILGDHVIQKGSDINSKRLRFDFSHPKQVTDKELEEVENMVNKIIDRDLVVEMEEMDLKKAKKSGALYLEQANYPSVVKVYKIKDEESGEVFSKELCGGPHIDKTSELGKFKITKEESVGAGIRRIKAILKDD